MDLQLRGKLALVTGGSRGIGLRIARCLAEEGCAVALCGRTADTVDQAVATLRAGGATAYGVVADVTASGAAERFVEEGARALGGVDLLVNNVGGSAGGGFPEATMDDWQGTFDVNLFQAVRCTRAALPHLRARGGGSVVIISSISGWKPGSAPQYAVAKAAEIMLASSLALELAPDRIRVNTVSPGSILFEGGGWEHYQADQPERFAEFERREFPWGRLGTPEEVADVVAFVLSPRAAWINGAHIPVDGGQVKPSVRH